MRRAPVLAAAVLMACARDTAVEDTARDSTPTVWTESAPISAAFACRIDSTGIGGIRLGMTLGEARGVIPGSRLERTSDGEGVALVAVHLDTTALVTLYADEASSEAPVDWSKRIEDLETFSASCTTRDGVGPGSLAVDAERALGKTVRIVESEIESRQYITFERQPSWMTVRLDYTAVFPPGSRETTQVPPRSKLWSIAVRTPR